ncbi:hypothetical protein IQ06DRAFT_24595 [Phaeosphaeriaceae sp. SRC1lsM3a]|nr:hypothetical protein IQ06DRAFT_24595 [Stagonospora sp. SRC1lsM3a]
MKHPRRVASRACHHVSSRFAMTLRKGNGGWHRDFRARCRASGLSVVQFQQVFWVCARGMLQSNMTYSERGGPSTRSVSRGEIVYISCKSPVDLYLLPSTRLNKMLQRLSHMIGHDPNMIEACGLSSCGTESHRWINPYCVRSRHSRFDCSQQDVAMVGGCCRIWLQ